MKSQEIVVATRNAGKLREFRKLMPKSVKLLSLDDVGFSAEIDEPYDTFSENAMTKARTVYQYCQIPVIADDSGLEVLALDGAPGVRSARYAGEDASDCEHVDKVLEVMSGEQDRRAQFVCVLAWVDGDDEQSYRGTCEGRISESVRGVGGFGYDPVFIPQGYDQTFGELDPSIKNSLSHRSEAIRRFVADKGASLG